MRLLKFVKTWRRTLPCAIGLVAVVVSAAIIQTGELIPSQRGILSGPAPDTRIVYVTDVQTRDIPIPGPTTTVSVSPTATPKPTPTATATATSTPSSSPEPIPSPTIAPSPTAHNKANGLKEWCFEQKKRFVIKKPC